jgi:cell division ATPase FtsA
MMDGQIHDIGQVARTIEQIHKRLEEMTGRQYKEVCIAAAGRVLKTVEATADIHFSSETVVTSDQIYSLDMLGVEKAYETLRQELQSDNVKFYCVGYSVKQYYQNDYPISNLEGHKCTDIRTELIATFLPDEVVDGLYAAVERAGLYVANLTLEPIAAINVAIPEKFRLLNIALVDVGAGTSDISITRDGSIIAYGMIPYAGDEVTEAVAKHYLTDFTEADRMKCMSTAQEEVTYHDIMGIPQKIPSKELVSAVDETVRMITKNVSDKITELNGGKPVSAIFVVGGGGKVGGFVETLAEYQGLAKERVALRGEEVLGNVKFLQEDITVDSLLVTPIGICLNYYEQKNNFIFVTVNGERIKLYDNNKLTIIDAAMQVGFPNEELFPQRGDTVEYYVNGEKRMLRGEAGEAAVIHINGKETGINTPIESNDKITIQPSTKGAAADVTIGKIPEYKATISFVFNGKKITCDRFVSVNGNLVSEFYQIKDGDKIEILDYYTLKQVLEFMDILRYENVSVNNMPAKMDTKVYDNFTILCDVEEQIPTDYVGETFVEEEIRESIGEESEQAETEQAVSAEAEKTEKKKTSAKADKSEEKKTSAKADKAGKKKTSAKVDKTEQTAETAQEEDAPKAAPYTGGPREISITVNGEPVVLSKKADYILVDVLDFYPVDTAEAHGERLEVMINGVVCDFTHPVEPGDQVRIEWVG